jgi:hypothetical protein
MIILSIKHIHQSKKQIYLFIKINSIKRLMWCKNIYDKSISNKSMNFKTRNNRRKRA